MTSRIHAINRGTLFAVVALIALVSATSLAMSNSGIGNTDNEYYVGTRDNGAAIAHAAPVKTAKGSSASWGVFAYRSDRGMSCVQAGMFRDGALGAYSGKGFERYSPRDSIGNCGDLTETFASIGGAVYAASAPASEDVSDQAVVVYGLLSKEVTNVKVTIDETSERLPVELSDASDLSGATQSFIAPLPPGASLPGVTVTFDLASGKQTVSKI